MTDTTVTAEAPRNDAGQFESAEPLTGQAGLEHDQGFTPLEKPEAVPEELSKDEVAEKIEENEKRLQELSGSQSNIVTYTMGMPDSVTLTLDQAAAFVKDAREADDNQAALDAEKQLKKEVDKLRGETEPRQAQLETTPASDEEEIARALKIPKVKEALQQRVTETETQRQRYEAGVTEAGKFAIAAITADFPELANLPLDRWATAINAMHQREPARFRQAVTRLQTLAQVEAAANGIKAQKAAREQAQHREYATRENQRFTELTKGIPASEMRAIEAHVPKMLAEHGADVKQFLEAVSNQSTFPRATAEALLVKAARYDLLTKAARAAPARAAVPHVNVPGVAGSRGAERGAADLASLNAKLSKSGNIKDAAALLQARRAKGR